MLYFFPVPPDVMLAPMCAVAPKRALRLAFYTTLFSVLGGFLGYAIGFFLFDLIQTWLSHTRYWGDYNIARSLFDKWGGWAVFVSAFSPIPYKVFTFSAGVLEQNLLVFGVASLLGRGGRFILVALLSSWLGPKFLPHIERWIHVIGYVVAVAVLVIVIWLIK